MSTTHWSDTEFQALITLFPGLIEYRTTCPVHDAECTRAGHYPNYPHLLREEEEECCEYTHRGELNDVLAHLNDQHHWPRTEKDRGEENQGLPTIHGWLKEQAEKNGWDLTCRTST